MSHLGRPQGSDPAFSLKPVEERLRDLLPDERIRLLENTRFDPREKENDPTYAQELAANGDLFVNDAFGSAHRAHASTEGVARVLPAYAGLLLRRELEELGSLLEEPERPFVVVLGGAKVADKIGVLTSLGERADTLLIGGKMAEEVERDARVRAAGRRRRRGRVRAGRRGAASCGGTRCRPDGSGSTSDRRRGSAMRRGSPKPARSSGTAPWASSSGRASPTGRRRSPRPSRRRTRTPSSGGGDSVRAVEELGVAERIDWISTGGGASLELLEGKVLPGVVAIPEA